ncbi:MAG: hypothetical protein HYU80_03305 [Candidatus Blackburnbacteria bacterium]|nr:hypothetical protein [Candidatus Blackburnbacteria bacterium]
MSLNRQFTKPVSKVQSRRGLKGKFPPSSDGLVESIRDIGKGTFDSFKNDLVKETSKDFLRQMLGFERPRVQASGELVMGQTIEIDQIIESQNEEKQILQARLLREKQLREEDHVVSEQKNQELKVQLHAVIQEVSQLATATVSLSEKVKIAAVQAPANPGVYHLVFFEKLLSFMRSFRKKIQNASVWIHSSNKRARRQRTFWGQVGSYGAKRLLSSEDSMTRSAG